MESIERYERSEAGSKINGFMNYTRHYYSLIEKAKSRTITEYTEEHHIIPKCIGGSDDRLNLVKLTPEEHYVAHQLLVKMYPYNKKLIHAAVMMTVDNKNINRSKNKLYGWLRKKLSVSASYNQTGKHNSQYGRGWICNLVSREIKRVDANDPIPEGWVKGKTPNTFCKTCSIDTGSKLREYCDACRPRKKQTVFRLEKVKRSYTDEEKAEALIKSEYNIRRALFSLGLNDSGENYRMMKKLNASVSPLATNQEKGNWTHAGSTPA